MFGRESILDTENTHAQRIGQRAWNARMRIDRAERPAATVQVYETARPRVGGRHEIAGDVGRAVEALHGDTLAIRQVRQVAVPAPGAQAENSPLLGEAHLRLVRQLSVFGEDELPDGFHLDGAACFSGKQTIEIDLRNRRGGGNAHVSFTLCCATGIIARTFFTLAGSRRAVT